MIVPSIDVINGRAVQLRRGREFVLDGGDPLARLEQFAVAGEVAVVDLDAALGRGSNADLIREMVRRAPCRVGGGIRDLDAARERVEASEIIHVKGSRGSNRQRHAMHDDGVACPNFLKHGDRSAARNHEILGDDLEPVDWPAAFEDFGVVLRPQPEAEAEIRRVVG